MLESTDTSGQSTAGRCRRRALSRNKTLVFTCLVLLASGWAFSVIQQYRHALVLKSLGADVTYCHGNAVGVSFGGNAGSFGDSEMSLLHGLPYLEWLRLEDTKVTNSGLPHVAQLSRLRQLSVRVDQISDERERELRTAMPELAIEKLWVIGGRKVVDGFQ